MKNKEITFSYTFDAKKASRYNGFISTDGKFYLVSEKSSHLPTHETWANEYVLKQTNYIKDLANPSSSLLFTMSRLKDKQDVLIHFYGFVYYSHDDYSKKPIIICPDWDINNKSITKEQQMILYDVMRLNCEEEFYPFDSKKYEDDEKHKNYVDNFISKRL